MTKKLSHRAYWISVGSAIGLVAALMTVVGVPGLVPSLKSVLSVKPSDIKFASEDGTRIPIADQASGLIHGDIVSIDTNTTVAGDLVIVANEIDLGGNALSAPGATVIVLARTVSGGTIDVSGRAGTNGKGEEGQEGGSVFFIAATIRPPLALDARGGQGGKGERGTDGSDGRDGNCAGFGAWKKAERGSDGSPGLPGGNGGAGGHIRVALGERDQGLRLDAEGGTEGEGGEGGRGGAGGRGCTGLGGSQSTAPQGRDAVSGVNGAAGPSGTAGPLQTVDLGDLKGIAQEIQDLLSESPDPCGIRAVVAEKMPFPEAACATGGEGSGGA